MDIDENSKIMNAFYNMNNEFAVVAHRGASTYAPENTYAAFDLALRMGAKHLELDVHLSADGELVVIHDAKLDRTTNGNGTVVEKTLGELLLLDAGSWFSPEFTGERIPLLADFLRRYRDRAHLHVEIKGGGTVAVEQVGRMLRELEMIDQVSVTSFGMDRIKEMRKQFPEIVTGILVREVTDAVVETARELGIAQICPKAEFVTSEIVRSLKEQGFVVRAWGVYDEKLMRKVIRAGVDGMTVNFPDKGLQAVACLSE